MNRHEMPSGGDEPQAESADSAQHRWDTLIGKLREKGGRNRRRTADAAEAALVHAKENPNKPVEDILNIKSITNIPDEGVREKIRELIRELRPDVVGNNGSSDQYVETEPEEVAPSEPEIKEAEASEPVVVGPAPELKPEQTPQDVQELQRDEVLDTPIVEKMKRRVGRLRGLKEKKLADQTDDFFRFAFDNRQLSVEDLKESEWYKKIETEGSRKIALGLVKERRREIKAGEREEKKREREMITPEEYDMSPSERIIMLERLEKNAPMRHNKEKTGGSVPEYNEPDEEFIASGFASDESFETSQLKDEMTPAPFVTPQEVKENKKEKRTKEFKKFVNEKGEIKGWNEMTEVERRERYGDKFEIRERLEKLKTARTELALRERGVTSSRPTKEYVEALEVYQKLRAEYVGEHVLAGAKEAKQLADGRAEAFIPKKGLFEKFRAGWHWLSNTSVFGGSLERTGTEKGGFIRNILRRQRSFRSVIGYGLLGASIFNPATVLVNRFLAGAGASVTAYDWMKSSAEIKENKKLTLNKEQVEQMSLAEMDETLNHFYAQARFAGKRAPTDPSFKLVYSAHRERLKKEGGGTVGEKLQSLDKAIFDRVGELEKGEKKRRWGAVLAGIGAALGINLVRQEVREGGSALLHAVSETEAYQSIAPTLNMAVGECKQFIGGLVETLGGAEETYKALRNGGLENNYYDEMNTSPYNLPDSVFREISKQGISIIPADPDFKSPDVLMNSKGLSTDQTVDAIMSPMELPEGPKKIPSHAPLFTPETAQGIRMASVEALSTPLGPMSNTPHKIAETIVDEMLKRSAEVSQGLGPTAFGADPHEWARGVVDELMDKPGAPVNPNEWADSIVDEMMKGNAPFPEGARGLLGPTATQPDAHAWARGIVDTMMNGSAPFPEGPQIESYTIEKGGNVWKAVRGFVKNGKMTEAQFKEVWESSYYKTAGGNSIPIHNLDKVDPGTIVKFIPAENGVPAHVEFGGNVAHIGDTNDLAEAFRASHKPLPEWLQQKLGIEEKINEGVIPKHIPPVVHELPPGESYESVALSNEVAEGMSRGELVVERDPKQYEFGRAEYIKERNGEYVDVNLRQRGSAREMNRYARDAVREYLVPDYEACIARRIPYYIDSPAERVAEINRRRWEAIESAHAMRYINECIDGQHGKTGKVYAILSERLERINRRMRYTDVMRYRPRG
jgi:hypothetical protein